jgi:hypothetical protein
MFLFLIFKLQSAHSFLLFKSHVPIQSFFLHYQQGISEEVVEAEQELAELQKHVDEPGNLVVVSSTMNLTTMLLS